MDDLKPMFEWPGGHRSALSVLFHVPGFGFSEDGTSQEDLIGMDYTQPGLRHLFRLLADLDIKATIAFTAEAVVDAPHMVSEAYELGHEVAASCCSATGTTGDLLSNLRDETGERVGGLVSKLHGFPINEIDDSWGNDTGKAWIMDGSSGDLPVQQYDPDAAIIPSSPYLIDTVWLSPVRPLPPSSLLETWMQALDTHRQHGSFMNVVVHPHIIGRPGFIDTLQRFLDNAIAYGDVWITRLDHIAATWSVYHPHSEEN